jgi:hypothetical protein
MYDNENDEFGEEVGAIKIKDGLFIGDYFSSSVFHLSLTFLPFPRI